MAQTDNADIALTELQPQRLQQLASRVEDEPEYAAVINYELELWKQRHMIDGSTKIMSELQRPRPQIVFYSLVDQVKILIWKENSQKVLSLLYCSVLCFVPSQLMRRISSAAVADSDERLGAEALTKLLGFVDKHVPIAIMRFDSFCRRIKDLERNVSSLLCVFKLSRTGLDCDMVAGPIGERLARCGFFHRYSEVITRSGRKTINYSKTSLD